MNKDMALYILKELGYVEGNCWIPKQASVGHCGKVYSVSYLAYLVSGSTCAYQKKQKIVRKCGTRLCLSPEHLLFGDMDRFISRLTYPNGPHGCWVWTGSTDGSGYGTFVSKKYGREKAHRISYMEWVGDIPEGMQVCHKCDIPSCVNPEHLFIGTLLDNMRDKVMKNRSHHPTGDLNGRAMLSLDDVKNMRKDYESGKFSYKDLVIKYKISQTQVGRIIKKESWGWL